MVFSSGTTGSGDSGTGTAIPTLAGDGAPDNSLGVDGQVYIDTTNRIFYGPKQGGDWGEGIAFGATSFEDLGGLPEGIVSGTLDLQLVQTGDGRQHYLWERDPSHQGAFTVEVVELETTQDISSAGTATAAADGRIQVTIAMETDSVYALAPAATAEPEATSASRISAILDETSISTNSATVWFYLPDDDDFATAGTYYVSVIALDPAGNQIGETNEIATTVAAHGSPQAPRIMFAQDTSTGHDITVLSEQSPHMLGFYEFTDITYYVEYNTTGDPADQWTRLAGVQAVPGVQTISIASQQPEPVLFRVVAENPLGEGQPSELI